MRQIEKVAQVYRDSGKLLEEIAEFVEKLNTIPEEEAYAELQNCDSDVLKWLLHDIAIPNLQYDIAAVILNILNTRST